MQPTNVGPYRLLHPLGAGGMAEVFLALQRGPSGFQKLIVVKRLRDGMGNDPHFERMFLNEARLAARLNHPNVVQTFEVGVEGRVHFIAMEYLAGQPVNRVLQHAAKHPDAFPLAVRLQIVSDCLAGLDYAHSLADFDGRPLGIVHRDISPHNVFVTYDGVTKVVDFGIAKATESPQFAEMSTTGALKGKIRYMAPEQLRGENLDRRADVYSMGVLLWEAVGNGKRMWADEDDITVIMSLSDGITKTPEQADPNVDPELSHIMRGALAGFADQRYRSCEAFRVDLDRYLARIGGPVSPREIGAYIDRAFDADKKQLERAIRNAMDAAEEELDEAMTLLRTRESIEEAMLAGGRSSASLNDLFRRPASQTEPPPRAESLPRVEHSTSAVVVVPPFTEHHDIASIPGQRGVAPGPSRAVSAMVGIAFVLSLGLLLTAAFVKLRPPRGAGQAVLAAGQAPASASADIVKAPDLPPIVPMPSAAESVGGHGNDAKHPPAAVSSARKLGPLPLGGKQAPAPGGVADPPAKPGKKAPVPPGDEPPLHLLAARDGTFICARRGSLFRAHAGLRW